MTLPLSGAISIGDINVELGYARSTQSSLGSSAFRALAGIPSGAISLSNFYGKSATHYIRPSTYSVSSAAGGYVTNPTNAYDGTGTLDSSTYCALGHYASGTYSTTEKITFSGFGTGTHSGTIYIALTGWLLDNGLTATSEVWLSINGGSNGTVDSNGDGTEKDISFMGGSAISMFISGQNLATLTVELGAMGGKVVLGDSGYCELQIYDVLFIY